ncbi:MAG: hypothetical protein ACJAWV_000224 [Flammeovirgaceae bacterium]
MFFILQQELIVSQSNNFTKYNNLLKVSVGSLKTNLNADNETLISEFFYNSIKSYQQQFHFVLVDSIEAEYVIDFLLKADTENILPNHSKSIYWEVSLSDKVSKVLLGVSEATHMISYSSKSTNNYVKEKKWVDFMHNQLLYDLTQLIPVIQKYDVLDKQYFKNNVFCEILLDAQSFAKNMDKVIENEMKIYFYHYKKIDAGLFFEKSEQENCNYLVQISSEPNLGGSLRIIISKNSQIINQREFKLVNTYKYRPYLYKLLSEAVQFVSIQIKKDLNNG